MDLEKEFLTELKKRRLRRSAKQFTPGRLWPPFSAKAFSLGRVAMWLGLGLLLFGLIHQVNVHLGTQPTDDLLTRLAYRSKPPEVASPWPWKEQNSIHPAVVAMPPDVETSIKSVATYLSQHEQDPYQQVKAIHDYVVSRLTYDLDVLKTGVRPSQEAKAVFQSHKAVCEGYAKLFEALGKAMGLEVVYVEGRIRQDLVPLDLIPLVVRLSRSQYDWTLHAWNAVKVSNSWQLVDTTWDDSGDSRESAYNTNYLMPPPAIMVMSHLPERAAWQLLPESVNHKTFEARPILRPEFFAEGLNLIQPTTYKTKVTGASSSNAAPIQVETSPDSSHKLEAIFTQTQSEGVWVDTLLQALDRQQVSQETLEQVESCQISQAQESAQIFCPFPKPGFYEVLLFSLGERQKTLLGQLKFHVT
ncbi:MAG TPA: transglutaminase domain-containing protein [Leptolyngbyaceae cyanobacterium]